MKGLIDTSVFIAEEARRPPAQLPQQAAISVVTLAGLHLGVLMAADATTRAGRLRTVTRVEREIEAIPLDDETARVFAAIVADARARGRRPGVMDAWIAATAVRHGLTLYTQDADFDDLPPARVQKV